jgi:type II secretory ATPase GspE/PulE/Tfp pilus assembly ATPase PilB-like protein
LKTHAAKQGVLSLSAQSAAHVVAGHTTIEEIRRVVGGV